MHTLGPPLEGAALANRIAGRELTGEHRWDEVWDGEWFMPPSPNRRHQDLESALEDYLRRRWARPRGGKVYHQINVAPPGGWPERNFRIPDLVLLTPARFEIDKDEYFEGAPEVVVEIHSPGHQAHSKLPFYAALGVPEAWVIDRDSRHPEIFRLEGTAYAPAAHDADGWVFSNATGIELRADAARGKLSMRLRGDEATREELPED
jgi:Uma2 family endonuclease